MGMRAGRADSMSDVDARASAPGRSSLAVRVCAALYYILTSVCLTSFNKLLFDSYPLRPDVLVLAQSVTAALVLAASAAAGRLRLPRVWLWTRASWALYAVFIASHVLTLIFSLLALSLTSMVMCNTLRRTSILFVVLFHFATYKSTPPRYILLATFLTLYGAFYAARKDLHYDPRGYVVVFLASTCFLAFGRASLSEESIAAVYLFSRLLTRFWYPTLVFLCVITLTLLRILPRVLADLFSSIYLVLVRPVRRHLNLSNLQLQFLNTICTAPCLAVFITAYSGSVVELPSEFRTLEFGALLALSCLLAIAIGNATYANTSVNNAVSQVVSAQVKDVLLLVVSLCIVDKSAGREQGNLVGVILSFCGSLVYGIGGAVEYRSNQTHFKDA